MAFFGEKKTMELIGGYGKKKSNNPALKAFVIDLHFLQNP
jgi:hypothetical protein